MIFFFSLLPIYTTKTFSIAHCASPYPVVVYLFYCDFYSITLGIILLAVVIALGFTFVWLLAPLFVALLH